MKDTNEPQAAGKVQKVEHHVWGRVKAGFMMFVPILVTYLVLRFLVGYTDGLLAPVLNMLPFNAPGLSLMLLILIFYFSGLVVSPKVGRMTVAAQHAVFSRIPVVKSIYGLTEQVAGHLSSYDKQNFSRVVLVEWPKPNVYALGFVTGQTTLQGDEEDRVSIYIPTVPNPTSGMFALMSQSEVVDTDITVEEALKLVLSGGIVLPEKMKDVRLPQKDKDEQDDPDVKVSLKGYLTGRNGYDNFGGNGALGDYRARNNRNGYRVRYGNGGRSGERPRFSMEELISGKPPK